MLKYKNTELIFKDRTHAGEMLADKLTSYKLLNPVVVGLPRGGVAVAKPVSDRLGVKQDIIVSKKIGVPGNPELAIGAVTSHGDYVISSFVNYELGEKKWDYLQKQIVYLINDCRERELKYLSTKHPLTTNDYFKNKDVILVDDGTATGMTAMAAIKSIKKQLPSSLILAIPVISIQAYEEIINQVDEIESLKIPKDFVAVSLHYASFEAITDDEIKSMLGVC